nr:immunoglobulin heavy chain junction region [Macaca mulatta]MOW90318.1 immunoglobulin heavy chain junction region [Macaca mulatta]
CAREGFCSGAICHGGMEDAFDFW